MRKWPAADVREVEQDDVVTRHDMLTGEHSLPACWFESLAVASRPLQRLLAETNFEFRFDFARIVNGLYRW
jgi:hypothetical protein